MKEGKKKEIAKKVIITIGAIGLVAVAITCPGIGIILKMFKPKNEREEKTIYNSLNYLKRKGLINFYRANGKYHIGLSKKGVERFNSYKIDQIKLPQLIKWDGYWRMVMFDIEEGKRAARIALSHKLKQIGFYPFQKSMFLYPYDCKKEIDFIRGYFNVKDEVKYFLVKDFEGNKKLKKQFNLV